MNATIITIEGNIGSGKTTLLEQLSKTQLKKQHIVVYEKVADWTSMTIDGKSIFDLYYENKQRYAYIFQSYVLMSRVSHLLEIIKANPGKIVICERSFMTDLEVFAKTLFESGDISELEWNVYVKWHQMVCNVFDCPISGQIYLRTSPTTCKNRISIRNRQSENLIDMQYLQALHEKHETWFTNNNMADIPTCIIGDESLETSVLSAVSFINKIIT